MIYSQLEHNLHQKWYTQIFGFGMNGRLFPHIREKLGWPLTLMAAMPHVTMPQLQFWLSTVILLKLFVRNV